MSISEIVSKYSKALVSVIRGKQINQKGLIDIENLIKFIENKQVKEKLLYPFWSAQKKSAIFNQLNLSPFLVNFINEVLNNKRSELLEGILKKVALNLKPVRKNVIITSFKVNKIR